MTNELNYLENIILEYLRTRFKFSTKKQDYKIFNNKRYASLPPSELKEKFGLSPYQQRNILKRFESLKLLSVKLGKSRSRYFTFDDLNSLDIEYLKLDARQKILKLDDLRKLIYINEVLDKIDEVIHD